LAIARAITERSKRLGRALGVSDDNIDTIVRENKSSPNEQAFQILQKWIQKEGSNANYSELAKALLDRTVMRKDVIHDFCLASKSKSN